jgi:CRP-like cAMP-binding protein
MAIDALVKPFLSLPLFRDLNQRQLSEIAHQAERIVYRPGDTVVAEDQLAEAAILIVSGTCARRMDAGDATREELLPEGALIAELAMLVEMVHPATIIAKDQVKALRLPREKMHQLMQSDVDLAERFSSHILKRLRSMTQDLLAIDRLLLQAASTAKTTSAQLALETSSAARIAQ